MAADPHKKTFCHHFAQDRNHHYIFRIFNPPQREKGAAYLSRTKMLITHRKTGAITNVMVASILMRT